MPIPRTNLDHFLQLRLSKTTVAEIDHVIGTIPQLGDFNRCRLIRYAVQYVLESIAKSEDVTGAPTTGTVRASMMGDRDK